jgi:L-ribulose-5-phosphate 3-epimerase
MTDPSNMLAGRTGSRVAGSTNSYHSHSLEDALAGIARAGFTHVELAAVQGWTEHIDLTADPSATQRLLEREGLGAVSLSAHSDLTTEAGRAHLDLALTWASRAGIRVVNSSIGGHASATDDRQAFLSAAPELAERARRAGVVIALETHGAIMGSGAAALPLLAEIDSEWIRLNYDTANVEYYAGVRAESDLASVAGYLASVHLKDHVGGQGHFNFPALGDGMVAFGPIFQILREASYAGPIGVEIEFRGDPWPPLAVVDYAMDRSFSYLRAQGIV